MTGCFSTLFNLSIAQDWRLSGGYSMQRYGFNYLPNSNYAGPIEPSGKGMLDIELERYFLYRMYLAGKAEILLHNEESVFLGGPVNFDQVNLGAIVGLQFDKWGIYGGVKAGRIWDIQLVGLDSNDQKSWMKPISSNDVFTTAFTGGFKYYLMSFLRLQLEVTKYNLTPEDIIPEYQAGITPAFNEFDFNDLTLSVGISISIPWHSKNKLKHINDRGSLPILDAGPVSFSSPMRKPAVITSAYGPRWNRVHQGVDIDAERGQKILAAADGIISKAGVGNGYGKMVKIRHSGGFITLYAHLRQIKVKAGQKVRKGDVIGLAGNTGTSSGVHLHFEVLKNEVHVDPQSYVRF